MNDEAKFLKMTTAPLEKLIISLAIPTILIMLVTALYNSADMYFVGKLGNSATAAVGVSLSIMAIIQATGFFFGQGAGNYVSRALGAKRIKDAEQMAATGFFLAFTGGVLIAVLGTIFIRPLASALGATETSLDYTVDYIRFILLAAPFMVSSTMLNNLLRFQGSAVFSAIGMVSGAVLNVALDPLLIYVFDLGVSGAAIATAISQFVAFLLLLSGCQRKGNVRISIKNFKLTGARFYEIFKGGLPSLLRQALMSLATIALNNSAKPYGDAVIAAVAVVNRIVMMANSTMLGLGQGFQPVCGFCYGAKLYNRVKRGFRFCVTISAILLTICAVFLFIFAPSVIGFFRDDPVVIETALPILRVSACIMPFMSWIVLTNTTLQTTGQALPASILSFARQGFFQIPFILIAVPFLGVRGIQMANPIADFCTFLVSLPFGISILRRMKEPDAPVTLNDGFVMPELADVE